LYLNARDVESEVHVIVKLLDFILIDQERREGLLPHRPCLGRSDLHCLVVRYEKAEVMIRKCSAERKKKRLEKERKVGEKDER